jgi:hypothetical protein
VCASSIHGVIPERSGDARIFRVHDPDHAHVTLPNSSQLFPTCSSESRTCEQLAEQPSGAESGLTWRWDCRLRRGSLLLKMQLPPEAAGAKTDNRSVE